MSDRRHPDEASDTGLSITDEERIRDDERRRVLAELARSDDAATGRPAGEDGGADWRTAPPPVGETPVDPAEAVVAGPPPAAEDPRRWDVPDDRWTSDEPEPATTRRTDGGATVSTPTRTATSEVPVTRASFADDEEVTERGFSPGQLLLALAGIASLVLGILALVRTGVEAPLDDPVESVLGWDHNAPLALIEIGAGAVMLLSSLRAGARWWGGLVGLALLAGGILIVGRFHDDVDRWIVDELAAERDFGWVAIGIGAAAVLGALIPRVRRTRRMPAAIAAPA